ncbi:uncharacterized protein LOC114077181 [Solanum pennellii]|uniref:Uncharacterized protein LOC114077181 n=1 Tax=Solanum pennellii TaxID=28526 RepID=A0ABM1VA92_SOLPN|nr:uncharacterized protein LOC114077181 [Solanum pennellii]
MGSLTDVQPERRDMVWEIQRLSSLGVGLANSEDSEVSIREVAESSIIDDVKRHQYKDPILAQYRDAALQKEKTPFKVTPDGVLRYEGRLCVPDIAGLRRQAMGEAHSAHRLTKSAHFLPVRTTYSAEDYARLYVREIVRLHGVPTSIISDRGAQFTANFWRSFQKGLGTQMAPYEALYGRKCRSPISWFDVGETKLIGPDVIQQAVDKVKLIQERLLVAQSRPKSYADNRRRDLEFQIGDWIIRRIGKVAYELDLLSDLEAVHPVFHVSMLRKCIGAPSRVFPLDDVQVTEELSYEEKPVAILDRQVHRYNC